MGTWDSGPFANDDAADYVADLVDHLIEPIDAFLADPQIDETFAVAFASLTLLNQVMAVTPTRPWDPDARDVRDPQPIVEGLLACFDEQMGSMGADDAFIDAQRAKLVAQTERFTAFLSR